MPFNNKYLFNFVDEFHSLVIPSLRSSGCYGIKCHEELNNVYMAVKALTPRDDLDFRVYMHEGGRNCAHHALLLGRSLCTYVGKDNRGAPVWPIGWRGSISHTATAAVAVVCRVDACSAIGIDIEQWMDCEMARDVMSEICDPSEMLILGGASASNTTRLFSAKEAIYKALFPYAGRFMEFSAARLTGAFGGCLEFQLADEWSEEWRKGDAVSVLIADTPSHVLSLALPSRHRVNILYS